MRSNPYRKSITIQDVAKAAGVSVSTVSRVLNDKDDVAFETFENVRRVIDELGYASSLAARGMRSHRTNLIGVILPDVSVPYSLEILRGVNRAIKQSDYELIIYTNGRSMNYYTTDEARYVLLLNGSIVDGVIVVTPFSLNLSTHAPLVVIDPNHENPNLPAIFATNREGALLVMHYLIGLGHRRIGFITGRPDLVSSSQRLQGYKEGLAEAGIPFDDLLVSIGDFSTEMAQRCARSLLARPDRPSAIFASNDMSAIGVYLAAEEAGLCIPQDLSVVGFDNIQESSYLKPALTTVDQCIQDMGFMAIEMVIELIHGEMLDSHQRTLKQAWSSANPAARSVYRVVDYILKKEPGMELSTKHDFQQAVDRIDAWWNGEIIDRAVVQVTAPRDGVDLKKYVLVVQSGCKHPRRIAGLVHQRRKGHRAAGKLCRIPIGAAKRSLRPAGFGVPGCHHRRLPGLPLQVVPGGSGWAEPIITDWRTTPDWNLTRRTSGGRSPTGCSMRVSERARANITSACLTSMLLAKSWRCCAGRKRCWKT